MITEDYVSFEIAKLLKEKDFDDSYCQHAYDREGKIEKYFDPYVDYMFYGMPTYQMVMKWLREVHNWTICISPYWPEGDMRNKLTWYYDIHSLIDNSSFRESSYTDNYTEACEAAIKYCLENLI